MYFWKNSDPYHQVKTQYKELFVVVTVLKWQPNQESRDSGNKES
jgi:hypothetical protein